MPGRNIYKTYTADTFYHIYNRGVNKRAIFLDDEDRAVFISLLKRYLGTEVEKKHNRMPLPNYHGEIDLAVFCLMRNHFHLLVYQRDATAMTNFMKSLSVAYSMYFNQRYERVGPLFQQRYRAVDIQNDGQFLHISRYIHMNPKEYKTYQWSSLAYYMGKKKADWLRPEQVRQHFSSTADYLHFLEEYEDRRDELLGLNAELANA